MKKYLHAQTANRRVDLQVVVHDPGEVGMSAVPMAATIRAMHNSGLVADQRVMHQAGGSSRVAARYHPVSGGGGTGGSGR